MPENYRPISLTCVLCKILESLIRKSIEAHVKEYNILSGKQYGFRKGRSTVLQLLKVLDEISEMLDSGVPVDIVYTDFQKAFDSVPYRRLLAKLESYGIQNKTLAWLKSFLIGRKQRVKIKGTTSAWTEVLSGVPQGSVLGPLLFILYINDITDNIKCEAFLYADDMKLYRGIKQTVIDYCYKLILTV